MNIRYGCVVKVQYCFYGIVNMKQYIDAFVRSLVPLEQKLKTFISKLLYVQLRTYPNQQYKLEYTYTTYSKILVFW